MQSLMYLLRLLLTTLLSNREIGRLAAVSHNTARRYRERLQATGLTWEAVKVLDEDALDARLNEGRRKQRKRFVEPDWSDVHTEMQRRIVTISLLHGEYEEALTTTDGRLSLTEFQRRYSRYKRSLGLFMRQIHHAGEKVFLDYSGVTAWLTDPATGARTAAQIFVAVLGASRFTYAEATQSQSLPDWIGAHVRLLQYYGGVPAILVPDNLKSAVTKVCWKDGSTINATYNEMAEHYDTLVAPARPRKPKDKALVEVGVQIVQRWILARLRHRTFHTLAELNAAIAQLLESVNQRPMRKMGGKTRRELFESLDRPALKPLPAEPYEFAEWRIGVKVAQDYCVAWQEGYYSVPSHLIGSKVNVKATQAQIVGFRGGKVVARHLRRYEPGIYVLPEHMPPSHRRYAAEDGSDLLAWAEASGPSIAAFVQQHRAANRAPNTSFQACRGLKALAREVGMSRLDAACRRALAVGAISLTSVRSTLRHGLEDRPLPSRSSESTAPSDHENVRGPAYFND